MSGLYRIPNNPTKREQLPELVIPESIAVTYPSQWFQQHALKPPLHIPRTNLDLPALRQNVYAGIYGRNLTKSLTVAYLYALFVSKPGQLTANWVSFNRTMGLNGEEVTLDNMMAVETPVEDISAINQAGVTEKFDEWMAIYLCGIYRINNAVRADYKVQVSNHITDAMRKAGGLGDVSAGGIIGLYTDFVRDRWFNALIGAIDMFLVKFPNHELAAVRVGTLTSRFKDCAILSDLLFLHKTTEMKANEFATWIWNEKMADQIVKVLAVNNEIDKEESNFTFFVHLKLDEVNTLYDNPGRLTRTRLFFYCVLKLFKTYA